MARRYGGDAAWYAGKIPLFASSDPALDAVWYYRWALFRAHQRDLGRWGMISTEFFDDVGWQREPYASLNDATGFHLYEGRWLRDRRYADDYITFLYRGGGNDRHFSEAIADAVWARYLVDGDRKGATRHLGVMEHVFAQWDDHFDPARGLYWIEPLLDATEYSVASIEASGGKDGFFGGHAFRPSINSYMAANATAISRIAGLAGDRITAAAYAQKAEAIKQSLLRALWSEKLQHFVDRYRSGNEHVQAWDQTPARELVGYLPWAYGVLGQERQYDAAWAHLRDPDGLAGAYGLRTAEPSYPYYMRQYRYDKATGLPECQWNGPVWPFQTTQALMAMERLLHARKDAPVTRGDYFRLLRQYAALHGQGGRLDLEEDYDPATGKPIVGLARSHHYFHSGFNDLVITGLAGIVPASGADLRLDPLLPRGGLDWFALQDVPYHGHLITLTYDQDGGHFHHGKGLRAYVDGKLAASRPDLGALHLRLLPRANPAIVAPINKAVQLQRDGWPHLSASSGAAPEKLHEAVDGRISFFAELPNGWDSTGPEPQEWFEIALERPTMLGRAELAFGQGDGLALPREVQVQLRIGGRWQDAGRLGSSDQSVSPLAWRPRKVEAVRLSLRKGAGQIRLVEAKLF
ncbi:glycogen debranching protein [Novosphingobium umbonatum]|uniref:Glycogen debranching protein n=1 Tax=Novosphingobium umbonatum TaxID=1908524 RepID=A0A437N7L3_9SPHN|nr:glycosyl hydrolase family 65 protein [Novosphingobium umbonatum]RVU05888.1 glycogen debranching protein [Novosphingobium umbonatum]